MISQDTLNKVQQFCTPAITAGLIPENEFKELLQSGTSPLLPQPLDPNLLTKKRTAQLLTISIRHLDRLHDKGKIEYIRVGEKAIRIPEKSLKNYLECNVKRGGV